MQPVLNLSREHIVQSIGVATESSIRTLSDFKDELIKIKKGKVIIIDEKKITKPAELNFKSFTKED